MYIAKELPLPRAHRNLLFNPSELYSSEIDVSETADGLIVKTKRSLCINRKSGIKKMVEQSKYKGEK
ncbi:MAG: hypothetical protein ACM3YE_17325 [Bacteroidota bacterium]